MTALLLATLLIVAPHPDDEVTLIPLIQSWDGPVVLLVMTDGAATGNCPLNGMEKHSNECRQARMDSMQGFIAATRPLGVSIVWAGEVDGQLTTSQVLFWATNVGDAHSVIWVAGADYGHRDHNAVRDAANLMGWHAYDGATYTDPLVFAAVEKWYGWLGMAGDPRLGVVG